MEIFGPCGLQTKMMGLEGTSKKSTQYFQYGYLNIKMFSLNEFFRKLSNEHYFLLFERY